MPQAALPANANEETAESIENLCFDDHVDLTGYPLDGNFDFRYLGNTGMKDWYVNCQLDYLKISFGETQPLTQQSALTLTAPTLEFRDMIRINAFYTAENTEDVVEMGMITYKEKVEEWDVETAD